MFAWRYDLWWHLHICKREFWHGESLLTAKRGALNCTTFHRISYHIQSHHVDGCRLGVLEVNRTHICLYINNDKVYYPNYFATTIKLETNFMLIKNFYCDFTGWIWNPFCCSQETTFDWNLLLVGRRDNNPFLVARDANIWSKYRIDCAMIKIRKAHGIQLGCMETRKYEFISQICIWDATIWVNEIEIILQGPVEKQFYRSRFKYKEVSLNRNIMVEDYIE